MKHRAHARFVQIGEIRMILFRPAKGADMLAVLDNIGNDEDFLVARQAEIAENVVLQRSKLTAEGDMLFGRNILPADQHHGAVGQGVLQRRDIGIGNGPRKVQTLRFRPDMCRKVGESNCCHGESPCCPIIRDNATASDRNVKKAWRARRQRIFHPGLVPCVATQHIAPVQHGTNHSIVQMEVASWWTQPIRNPGLSAPSDGIS